MPPLVRRSGEIEAAMLNRLFRGSPEREFGEALYAACVRQARDRALYETFAAPDTVEGRFELYTLHVVLLLDRLSAEGDSTKALSQALFDTFVKSLDHALREMGVGDLSVGRKMRKLGEAVYGRMKSFQAAVTALPDPGPLRDLLTRTVYAEAPHPEAQALAAYVIAQREQLAAQPSASLLAGRVEWRAP
jgi:cytochrome b pre-mRNA-processing protein 3